ncbi:MAG: toxin [Alphaproteobacteria bacterium]|nr:toxin [Alphaproteobacteria bacterium]
MKDIKFLWDETKDAWLRETRGVGFADVVEALINGTALADIQSPKRKNQRMIVFRARDYVHVAPYVIDVNIYFFKTIYPDRNLHAKYGS